VQDHIHQCQVASQEQGKRQEGAAVR